MHNQLQPTLRILRIRQVMDRIGICRSSIYEKINPKSPRHDPTFPKPVKLGLSAVGWIESDIHAWLVSRVPGK